MPPKVLGVEVPPMPRERHHSQPEETPPSQKIKQMVAQAKFERAECRVECKGEIEQFSRRVVEAERKASSADKLASQSAAKADNIDAKFRVIIAMLLGLSTIVLGVVGWLAVEMRASDARAQRTAEVVAEKTVLVADRRLDERVKAERIESIREYRRQESAEVDRLVAKAPK